MKPDDQAERGQPQRGQPQRGSSRPGSGKASPTPDDGMFGPAGISQRIHAAVYGAVGSLPRTMRAWAAVICHADNLKRLCEAMACWVRGRHLPKEQFAALFLGRDADDPLVNLLRSALPQIDQASGHAELSDAAAKIAAAIQVIGADRWPRFLVELEIRALDPATVAAIADPWDAVPLGDTSEADAEEMTRVSTGDEGANADQTAEQNGAEPGQPREHPPRIAAGPGEHPRPWGLPSPATVPPVRNPARLQPGPASQPSLSRTAGQSLWDDQGGEWQYQPGDAWHNPHWDYNEHADPTTPWRSIPIQNQSPWKS